jgi:hypothetical protein
MADSKAEPQHDILTTSETTSDVDARELALLGKKPVLRVRSHHSQAHHLTTFHPLTHTSAHLLAPLHPRRRLRFDHNLGSHV